MATVVDSLIVTLGLDPTDFDKGSKAAAAAFLKTRDAAKKAGKDIEDSSKFASDAIDRITKSALGFLGVLLGANSIKDFVAGVVSSNVALGNLSKNLGVSAQELAKWENAAASVGDTADGAAQSIQAASDQLLGVRVNGKPVPESLRRLFGQTGIKPDFANETTSQYLSDVARAAAINEKQYGRQQTALLLEQGGFGGIENLLLSGNAGARLAQAPAPTNKAITNSQDLNSKFQNWVQTASTQAGNLFAENAAPVLSSDIDTLQNVGIGKDISLAAGLASPTGVGVALGGFISDIVRNLQGGSGASTATGAASTSDQEAYIRAAALARGEDPDVAVRVARHEGLGNAYAGDDNSSFGPYQLHYGNASKQFPQAGMGDDFTKATGLDARDPSTWRQQIDYALTQVRTNGWTAFMGAAAAGVSRYEGIGGGSNVTTIGEINVNVPGGDATQIAANIAAAIKRSNMANLANSGSN